MKEDFSYVFSKEAIDFVTAATRYCIFIENPEMMSRKEFVDIVRKLLPTIYAKVSLVKKIDVEDSFGLQAETVTEQDYNYIKAKTESILGEQDDYLDVFVEDMKYSDVPIRKTVSEDLADIYQYLRNFVEIYKGEEEEAMYLALSQIIEDFETVWGQTLVNTLRAVHDIQFNQGIEVEE